MTILQSVKGQFNLRIYDESIPRIEKTLGLLTKEELWFAPNDQSNSVGHLILHLCGNVTQWMGSGLGLQPDQRVRDEEFNTKKRLSKKDLIARLTNLRPITDRALNTLTNDSDLLLVRSVQGFDETILSIIVHVIEHFSYHTGQIAIITKHLKNVDLGFYEGQNLDAKS